MGTIAYKGQVYSKGFVGVSDVLIDGVSKVSNGAAQMSSSEFGLIGEIRMFGGANAPAKWLICDGSEVSKTTYARLYNVIGDMYGTASDSSKFVLPDFTGRTPIGPGTGAETGATEHLLGDSGGEAKHTLSVGEMPNHTHASPWGSICCSDQGAWVDAGGISGSGKRKYVTTVNSGGNISWQGGTGGAYNANGTAHNIMQPYLTVNFIIFAGV